MGFFAELATAVHKIHHLLPKLPSLHILLLIRLQKTADIPTRQNLADFLYSSPMTATPTISRQNPHIFKRRVDDRSIVILRQRQKTLDFLHRNSLQTLLYSQPPSPHPPHRLPNDPNNFNVCVRIDTSFFHTP